MIALQGTISLQERNGRTSLPGSISLQERHNMIILQGTISLQDLTKGQLQGTISL